MICNKCHQDKSTSEFVKRAGTNSGIRPYCKTCCNTKHKAYYVNNRLKCRGYANKYYCNNRDKEIKRIVYGNLKARRQARLDCISHYSNGTNMCGCKGCGETHVEFLAIDHINGGGNKERKQVKEYLPLVLKRKGFPEGYRILCHNCNSSRGFYGYCPHEKENVCLN